MKALTWVGKLDALLFQEKERVLNSFGQRWKLFSGLMRGDATPSLLQTGKEEEMEAESELIVNDPMMDNKTLRRSRIKKQFMFVLKIFLPQIFSGVQGF